MNRLAFGREPALWLGLVQAALAGFVAFGVDLTQGQTAAVLGVSGALLAVIVRQTVYAPQSPALVSGGPGGTPRGGGQPDPQAPDVPPVAQPPVPPPAAPPAPAPEPAAPAPAPAPAPPVPHPDVVSMVDQANG